MAKSAIAAPVTQPAVAADMMMAQSQSSSVVTPSSNNQFGIFSARPDFTYNPGGLDFLQQATYTTGQIDMAVGPGIPTGTVRYIPTGEL